MGTITSEICVRVNQKFLFFYLRSHNVLSFQSIQRRLEEIEVDFKDLEEKGVVLERTLRGEDGETPQC